METQALRMIRELLSLTRQGKLHWAKSVDDCDKFDAFLLGKYFYVEFIYLARTDDVGSDRTIARLFAFNLYDYSIGTEGFDLLCEMLSLGDENWTEAREKGQNRLEDGMRFLQSLNETF